ncbi:MAG: flavin reductase [Alphaproteobacteria bacterium]|nr:MAG: flavin reductase [Alphaproteobacteria bacterium]
MSLEATPASIDQRALRDAFGRFATGVTVVTTVDGAGAPVGLTVNSFSSLSLTPPLVLWSLDKASSCCPAFEACDGFVVHVLADDQEPLSRLFASAVKDRFAGLDYQRNDRGFPLLPGTCARFQCRTAAVHEGGDHLILVGEVEAFDHTDRPPLLFWGGRYRHVAPATEII